MTILALDISLNTGWAAGDGTPAGTQCHTEKFHDHKTDCASLGRRFFDWVSAQILIYQPKVLVIEKPFFRGGSSWLLSGMVWEAHRAAHDKGVMRTEIAATTIKKIVTGSGKAQKHDVIKSVKKMGFNITDDHQADAVGALLAYLDKTKGA